MAKIDTSLDYINWLKTLGRKIGTITDIVGNSQQYEDFSEEEVALLKKLHDRLYWSGEVTFDKRNIDASKLKVH